MADDYVGGSSTTGRLVPTPNAIATTTGMLEALSDSDWFAVGLTSGLVYEFNLAGASNFVNAGNLDLTLVTASGTVLSGTGNADKVITYIPTATETDYLVVTSRLGNGLGSYTLSSGQLDDRTGDASTTGRITVGSSVTGVLERLGDSDWFATTLLAGRNYQFNFVAQADFTGDNSLRLRDANGVVVDGGSAYTSVQITPTATGTYYIDAASYSASRGTGSYTITTAAPDDNPNNASTTGRLNIGGSTSGALEARSDVDWFAVSLTSGVKYQFNSSINVNFTVPSYFRLELVNVGGSPLVGSGGSGAQFAYTPSATGIYYLRVSGSSATGSYGISASTIGGSVSAGGGTTGGGSTTSGGTSGGTSTSVTPVYRFFDSNTGTQFLTSSATERDTVIATRPDLISEGIGLNATASSDPNSSAVYRFFDKIYGTHFFTSSADERNTIAATRSDLAYEGIGFYQYTTQQPSSSPVYRFFDSNRGTHFFTNNAGERATIIATRSDLISEGVSFYSPI